MRSRSARPSHLTVALFLALGAGCIPRQLPGPNTEPSAALARIADEVAGRTTSTEAIPDISFAGVQAGADSARRLLERLDRIDAARLTHEEELTRQIIRWDEEQAVREVDLYWYTFPILPAISPLQVVSVALAARPLSSESDREHFLKLLAASARVFDATRVKSEGQAARGIVLPRDQIENVLPYLRSFATSVTRHPFFPADERLEAVPQPVRGAFVTRVASTIDSIVVPSARSLASYVELALRPRAPEAVGLGQYPGGKEAYRAMVKRETTLDVTPERVHEIGLQAVAAIEARMQQIRDSLGFTGTRQEFNDKLRRDPHFYVTTPDSVGARLLMFTDRIKPRLPDVFAHLPRAPFGVRRLDKQLEPSMTYGYYDWAVSPDTVSYYNYNGSQLDQRSLLMAGAIAYHELVPGHHFQIGLAHENQTLPAFRRITTHAGYTEGWAEYASSVVARDLGMYRDAYEVYGRLAFDEFFAVRLVVDVGMNYYGWPRSRAVAYMKEHTLESDGQIESETLRYSTRSPAQALAYRMGRETIVAARARCEQALGSRFDLRRFHDALLMSGSMPLFLLDRHIDWFVEQEKVR